MRLRENHPESCGPNPVPGCVRGDHFKKGRGRRCRYHCLRGPIYDRLKKSKASRQSARFATNAVLHQTSRDFFRKVKGIAFATHV